MPMGVNLGIRRYIGWGSGTDATLRCEAASRRSRGGALVSRVRDSMTKSGDAREDFIGRLGPHEWPRSFVCDLNVPPDGRLQLARAAMHAASQLLVGERREPAFDQVDPRGARRGEVHVVSWMAHEPAVDERRLVGSVVVET